jgi:hypothetical protein
MWLKWKRACLASTRPQVPEFDPQYHKKTKQNNLLIAYHMTDMTGTQFEHFLYSNKAVIFITQLLNIFSTLYSSA